MIKDKVDPNKVLKDFISKQKARIHKLKNKGSKNKE